MKFDNSLPQKMEAAKLVMVFAHRVAHTMLGDHSPATVQEILDVTAGSFAGMNGDVDECQNGLDTYAQLYHHFQSVGGIVKEAVRDEVRRKAEEYVHAHHLVV
jgi:hypothetical protein